MTSYILRHTEIVHLPNAQSVAPPALHPGGAIQGKEGIKFCHLATLSKETPETEDDYLKLIKEKSAISIERSERKGEWLTKECRDVSETVNIIWDLSHL